MSDRQREKHLAMYWNGPLTRSEAQKVFDETAGVIQHHQQTILKLDMVMAFLVEKSGHTMEEIQTWINERMAQAAAKAKQDAEEKTQQDAPEQPKEAPKADPLVN